jgi:hypothetical protein
MSNEAIAYEGYKGKVNRTLVKLSRETKLSLSDPCSATRVVSRSKELV